MISKLLHRICSFGKELLVVFVLEQILLLFLFTSTHYSQMNRDSPLFSRCTWCHFTKSNLSLQKAIFLCVSLESSLLFYSIVCIYFL